MALPGIRRLNLKIGKLLSQKGIVSQRLLLLHASKSTTVTENIQTKSESEAFVETGSKAKTPDGHPEIDLTFSNAQEAFRSKSNSELLRALLVLRLCSISFLVDNNKKVKFIQISLIINLL